MFFDEKEKFDEKLIPENFDNFLNVETCLVLVK